MSIMIQYLVKVFVLVIIGNVLKAQACTGNNAPLLINELLKVEADHKRNEDFYNIEVDRSIRLIKLYMQYRDQLLNKAKIYSPNKLRCFLFFGHIAYLRQDSILFNNIATDLILIYNEDKDIFWQVVSPLPFLMQSSCFFLSYYLRNNEMGNRRLAIEADMELYLSSEQKIDCRL